MNMENINEKLKKQPLINVFTLDYIQTSILFALNGVDNPLVHGGSIPILAITGNVAIVG